MEDNFIIHESTHYETMDCSSEEYEVDEAGKITDENSNALGFSGGPAWHYPEEEIEFFPAEDEGEDQYATDEIDAISCSSSCSSMDNYRLSMIENFIGTHDIHDEDLDLLYACNRNIDYALYQPPQSASTRERDVQKSQNDTDDVVPHNVSDCSMSISSSIHTNDGLTLTQTSPVSHSKKRHSWTPNSPLSKRRSPSPASKRRRRSVDDSITCDPTASKEQDFHRFKEAAMCVPFEYTTKLATFYIRRPYGVATVPETFRILSPHMTDEEYKKRSQVSASETIQVAISVSADDSLMLLYGSAGVRYKTDPSDVRCDDWVDIPDVGAMDLPLGYVDVQNRRAGNDTTEYSLDEILEEAMFVREQYCSTILSAAMEAGKHQLLATTKAPSPPSLTKSIVSTPPRSIYYYDGSNSTKIEEEQEEIEGRKLDFLPCVSPSMMTRQSNETTSVQSRRQEKRRRRRLRQFFQRVFIVIGFYVCGIFLVSNLSSVEYHRSSTVLNELIPPSYKSIFANTFHNTADEHLPLQQQPKQIKDIDADENSTQDVVMEDDGALHLSQIAEYFATGTNERIATDYYAFTQEAADERDSYKRKFERTQELLLEQQEQNSILSKKYDLERKKTEELQKEKELSDTSIKNLHHETEYLAVELQKNGDLLLEQVEQNNMLSEKYDLERTKTEGLQQEKEDAAAVVRNLSHEAVSLAVDLEMEQRQRQKLEETIRELEIQLLTLKQEKSQMQKDATASYSHKTSVEAVNDLAVQITEDAQSLRKGADKGFELPKLDEQKTNSKDYQIQDHQLNGKESSEAVGKNRSLKENQRTIDREQRFIARENAFLASPESVLLKSGLAKKGPIFPKVIKRLKNRFRRKEQDSKDEVSTE